MPMSFPDMKSLERAGRLHGFRAPRDGESEAAYRAALADHVVAIDIIESQEIRTGKGWDEWNGTENLDVLIRIARNGERG